METRTARLSVGHSGGTAGAGSRNYKVTLPTKWIERLGLGVNNREMELALDGDRIIITPRLCGGVRRECHKARTQCV